MRVAELQCEIKSCKMLLDMSSGSGELEQRLASDDIIDRDRDVFMDSDHLFRLFVGWVPKHFTENELQPYFEKCGKVKDLIILKDKVTGQPRGCAFVSYATKEEAELAITRLDRKLHLSGALSPLEVRFARSHQYIQAGAGPEDNRQLFFARAPVTASEEDVKNLFSKYGDVEEVNLFRERRTHLSKGCGFILMSKRDRAVLAMDALDEKHVMEGSLAPLAVKWADPDLQVKKRRAVEDSNAENRMLFFAKVLRSATEEEVKGLFGQFGKVYDVNLFRAFQGAPTTKGCGLVTLGTHEEAAAAIDELDSKFTWDGMDSPMVVKWMDAQLQKRRREEHLAAMRQGLVPSMGMGPEVWMPAPQGLQFPGSSSMTSSVVKKIDLTEPPPPGCAPDAIKLFVGNIPKNYTEEMLKPIFESSGKVVELVVVRDKVTHESKGSAFVWYANRAQAESAAQRFNLRHVLPDPSGEQDRPLVVRQANARQKNHMVSMVPHLPAEPYLANLSDVPVHLQSIMAQVPPQLDATYFDAADNLEDHFINSLKQASVPLSARHPAFYTANSLQPNVNALGLSLEGLTVSDPSSSSPRPVRVHDPTAFRGIAPTSAGAIINQLRLAAGESSMAAEMSDRRPTMDSFVALSASANPHGQTDGLSQYSVTLPLTAPQTSVLNNSLFSIQSMCGAQLRTAPGAPGLFYLIMSGSEVQVENAKQLVSIILQGIPNMPSMY